MIIQRLFSSRLHKKAVKEFYLDRAIKSGSSVRKDTAPKDVINAVVKKEKDKIRNVKPISEVNKSIQEKVNLGKGLTWKKARMIMKRHKTAKNPKDWKEKRAIFKSVSNQE